MHHTYEISGKTIKSINPRDKVTFLRLLQDIPEIPDFFLSVDLTVPNAVNFNCNDYCENDLPSLIGTSGGDRTALEKKVKSSDTIAVIAPNMATQVVAIQSTIEDFANEYAGAWTQDESGGLYIRESHQGVDVAADFKGKKDTSGTAKAMVKYFQKIGIQYDVKDIVKIRDIEDQLSLGIPKSALKGHGWHRYKLYSFFPKNQKIINEFYNKVSEFLRDNSVFDIYRHDATKLSGLELNGVARLSPDENVLCRIEQKFGEVKMDHNINGRRPYADGGLDGLRFLNKKIEEGRKGKAYSMVDVWKSK